MNARQCVNVYKLVIIYFGNKNYDIFWHSNAEISCRLSIHVFSLESLSRHIIFGCKMQINLAVNTKMSFKSRIFYVCPTIVDSNPRKGS